MSNETEQREQLAEYAHEAWSGWMKYLFSKCEKKKDKLIIPAWAVQRWTRQSIMPYAFLPEKEKESDRAEADKMLAIINGSTPRKADEIEPLHPSLADSAAPFELHLPWRVETEDSYGQITPIVFNSIDQNIAQHHCKATADAIVEAVNAYWGSSPTREDVNGFLREQRLRQRVAELEQAITKPVENWLDNRAELEAERGKLDRRIFELQGLIEQGEAANQAQTHEIGNLRDHSYKQARRITELKEQIEAYRHYGVDQAEEVARLRKGLESASAHLVKLTKTLTTDINWDVYSKHLMLAQGVIDQALAGAKGAESEQEKVVSVGRPDQRSRLPEDSSGTDGCDNAGDRDSEHHNVCDNSPTPLSEPLELDRLDMDCSYSIADVASILNRAMYRIEQRDAEIVAAIAELDWHLRHKGDLMNNLNDKIGRYKRDAAAQIAEVRSVQAAANTIYYEMQRNEIDPINVRLEKMQEQISAQADLQDEMQVAIGQIRSVQDAANGIYYEIQRDDIRPMQERLDAINKRLDEWEEKDKEGAEGIMGFIRKETERLDRLDRRIDDLALYEGGIPAAVNEHAEQIDALTEAVLMLVDEHRAEKKGMIMWGSGDFERMANKLREKGGE